MMLRTMLKSKIHRATVTDANIDYEGSITIDAEILEAADIIEHEKVHVLDLTNGSRLETYTIRGERGSGQVCINGAAAKLVNEGDSVIIVSYAAFDEGEVASRQAKVVLVDDENRITSVKEQGPAFDMC